MPKFTKYIKKHRKNITLKNRGVEYNKRGGYTNREGIIDVAENTATKALTTVGDIGLRFFGLERIQNNQHSETPQTIMGNVNEVLDSEIVENKVKETAKDTSEIIGKLTSRFNEAMDDPIIKENIEKSIKNAGELSNIAVESFKEPINRGVNQLVETANEAAPKFGKAVGKAAWDTVTSIPPISVVGDLLNITNDVTKAASAATDAGTQAIVAASDTFIEAKDNLNNMLKDLDERKKMAEEISNRTTNSINHFENPLTTQPTITGGRKSRRRLFKRKLKTKRVKFAN